VTDIDDMLAEIERGYGTGAVSAVAREPCKSRSSTRRHRILYLSDEKNERHPKHQ
jgi:hypothetical protein